MSTLPLSLDTIWGHVSWGGLLGALGFAAISGLFFFSAWRALSRGYCMNIVEDARDYYAYREDDPFDFYLGVFLRLFFGSIILVFVIVVGPQSLPSNAKALHRAAAAGDIEAVKQHLAAGTDMNVRVGEWGDTPLHRAAFEGYKEIVELLINNEVDVNVKDDYGCTPLHDAAEYGHKKIIELLISKGADVNAENDDGLTPLDRAEDKEMAALLRKHGAKEGN
jgi:ankyrin repeat protein